MWTWNSSTTPALRYCCIDVRAAGDLHVPVARGRPGLLERRLDPVGHEVERRPALHLDCGSRGWCVSTYTGTW